MKAIFLTAPNTVEVNETEMPSIETPHDAVVRISQSAVCGADLLPYHGLTPGFEFGMIPGHEFVGIVTDVGSQVHGIAVGERVVNTSMTSDGTCIHCLAGRYTQCKSRSLFGYSGVYPKLNGGQAEYVRIPYASRTLLTLPEAVQTEDALFLADILPTGYAGINKAGVGNDDLVVVQGAGPVGLMAVMIALSRGARVIAVDGISARRKLAEELGAVSAEPQDALRKVLEVSDDVGADVVVEASGSIQAMQASLHLARAQGIISVIGAHFENDFPLNNAVMFEKELTITFSIGDPFTHRKMLLEMIEDGTIAPRKVLTHVLPMNQAAEAYEKFDNKEFIKVALTFE